jgi:hypothetical protein
MDTIVTFLKNLGFDGTSQQQAEAFLSGATDPSDLEHRAEQLEAGFPGRAFQLSLMGWQSH